MATHLKWYKHDGKKTWNANSVQVETDDMVLFWHTPSVFTQWFQSSFVVDGEEFCCTEVSVLFVLPSDHTHLIHSNG